MRKAFLLLSAVSIYGVISSATLYAQIPGFNYDEAGVPEFTLPDVLVCSDGSRVSDVQGWENKRRPEILHMFEEQMYGQTMGKADAVTYTVLSEKHDALGGLAVRKEILLRAEGNGLNRDMELLLYIPAKLNGPVPAFVGLNFYGNHTISPESDIRMTMSWVRNNEKLGIDNHTAHMGTRGTSSHRWPVEMILKRGYAIATMYYGDIDPDFDDGFQNGIHPLFYRDGQTYPDPGEWGSIGAWSWALSRILDYMKVDENIDGSRVAVMGHSRLGKTSLWAGAQDKRFALVISNDSGCGGAALSRRQFGETVRRINVSFPHWFCDNFIQYNDREDELPFDQHMLIALIAPRPVYVASAEEDLWADPRGEYLSARHAAPVYKLYGLDALESDTMPQVGKPVMTTVGYHIRSGVHNVTDFDWSSYLDFADMHMK